MNKKQDEELEEFGVAHLFTPTGTERKVTIPVGTMLMCLKVKEGLVPIPDQPGKYMSTTQFAHGICLSVVKKLVEEKMPVIFFLPEDWELTILNEEGHNLLEAAKEPTDEPIKAGWNEGFPRQDVEESIRFAEENVGRDCSIPKNVKDFLQQWLDQHSQSEQSASEIVSDPPA